MAGASDRPKWVNTEITETEIPVWFTEPKITKFRYFQFSPSLAEALLPRSFRPVNNIPTICFQCLYETLQDLTSWPESEVCFLT